MVEDPSWNARSKFVVILSITSVQYAQVSGVGSAQVFGFWISGGWFALYVQLL